MQRRTIDLHALTVVAAAAFAMAVALPASAKCKPGGKGEPLAVAEDFPGLVRDTRAHLLWQRCSVGTSWQAGRCKGHVKLMSLPEAKAYAHKAGKGWRLPNVKELYGLLREGCSKPRLDNTLFPDVTEFGGEGGAPYWSDTPMPEIPSLIYYVDVWDGSADSHSASFMHGVRLVKDDSGR